ncbi:hypothetical protein MJO28_013366 [Puccinia striiformis f. sp. tritici]|nr:hypothetical protein Pst134EA_024182 [Puccinia striiformis f. sp. tritici]KAI9606634.1 hypothetical protein H4Q26_006170 [Puccinia striiformis f. sp. tritici PST-130]KNF04027.1 hypothetical protein PSTG_02737 [Puccinia striiformis f. sp. tritici PST-78]KAH9444606.1 hypothetical protein Pst134EB_024867 [Puccinia striiformis f. sp. tritici]KAH9453301.1 hypothetical protein Pst134EA_024182 [Puccinia striiformis f. sp. tritici]KAI7941081.1 hypothetical protein MJO28_013366 [Puccinia striiformis
MQFLNIYQISFVVVLLIQNAAPAAFSNKRWNFGCLDRISKHPIAGCVASIASSTDVSPIPAPWNTDIGAYDCRKSKTNPTHHRPTCCSDISFVLYNLPLYTWKTQCTEIDGSAIKHF